MDLSLPWEGRAGCNPVSKRHLTDAALFTSVRCGKGKCIFQLELEKGPHYSPSPKILTVSLEKMLNFYHVCEWLVSQYEIFIYWCM